MAGRTVLRDCPTYQTAKSIAPDAVSSIDLVSHYGGNWFDKMRAKTGLDLCLGRLDRKTLELSKPPVLGPSLWSTLELFIGLKNCEGNSPHERPRLGRLMDEEEAL